MNIETVIYLAQILTLLACIYMTWRVRNEISGLARGLIALFVLLIVRRIDDAFAILNATATLVLSSAVVIVVADDLYRIYKMRETMRVARILRKQQEMRLETMREKSEELAGKSWDFN